MTMVYIMILSSHLRSSFLVPSPTRLEAPWGQSLCLLCLLLCPSLHTVDVMLDEWVSGWWRIFFIKCSLWGLLEGRVNEGRWWACAFPMMRPACPRSPTRHEGAAGLQVRDPAGLEQDGPSVASTLMENLKWLLPSLCSVPAQGLLGDACLGIGPCYVCLSR